MSQAPQLRLTKNASPPPGLPREPLTPEKQLQALRLVQDQAEQRVNLGLQLYKAAEAHTAHQQELIEEIKAHQEKMRHEMQHDIASTLQTYDQWMASFDENFTRKLQRLEEKLDQKVNALEGKWESTQKRIIEMVRRAEALLDQNRRMLKAAVQQPTRRTRPGKPQNKPAAKTQSRSSTAPASKPLIPPAAYAVIKPTTQKFLPLPKTADPPMRKTRPKPNPVTPPAPVATGAANAPDTAVPPPPKAAAKATKPAAKQPDMIYSKALEHLKADPANKPPKND